MRASPMLLFGLAALVCSAEGFNIERDVQEPTKTETSLLSNTESNELGLTWDGNSAQIVASSDGEKEEGLRKLDEFYKLLNRDDDKDKKLGEKAQIDNTARRIRTVKLLAVLRDILDSEISNLVLLIADGQYDSKRDYKPKVTSKEANYQFDESFLSFFGMPAPPLLQANLFDLTITNNPLFQLLRNFIRTLFFNHL